MNIITDINQIPSEQWRDLLNTSKTSSFFQSKECYELYGELSFLSPFVFAVEDGGNLQGVIVGYSQSESGIKRYFSRRAIINGGPLLAEGISTEALSLLLNSCRKGLKGKAIYIETRNFEDFSAYKAVFEACGFEYEPHLNFKIDTSSEEVVRSNLGKSRKRDIRTSLRDGAVVIEEPTEEQVAQFYDVLNDLYTTKVKTPLWPLEFFQKLSQKEYAKFILVEYNQQIVGGTVCVCQAGKTVYEWYACGKDGVFKTVYPSSVATYSAIEYAAKNDYSQFDMMGAGKPDVPYGVRDFKAKFGGVLVEHGRFECVLNRPLYEIGKLGLKLLKKLK